MSAEILKSVGCSIFREVLIQRFTDLSVPHLLNKPEQIYFSEVAGVSKWLYMKIPFQEMYSFLPVKCFLRRESIADVY